MKGVRNGRCRCGSRSLSAITPIATRTKANRVPMFVSSITSLMFANAAKNATNTPVRIVVTWGVRNLGCSFAAQPGSSPSRAIANIILGPLITLAFRMLTREMTASEMISRNNAATLSVTAAGVDFAHRRFGRLGELPLVMLQHYRGNLDNWDPALVDALAAEREVILVDYPGVGSSTGDPSSTIGETARRMIAFIAALGLDQIDLLGFSIGGFVAQEIALVRPTLVRRLVLAATGPKGAPGMHG